MLNVIEAGKQAVILAPTEILANQHLKVFSHYLSLLVDGGTPLYAIDILTSSVRGRNRTVLLQKLKAKELNILVGTHALLNEKVIESFGDCGIVIIDEGIYFIRIMKYLLYIYFFKD